MSSSFTPTSSTGRKHNVATFAGAVGGSVGFLFLLSLGLACSLRYRRKRSAARRLRLEAAEDSDDDEESRPPMHGPSPFVPRYFPGTQPAAPPPYAPPAGGVGYSDPEDIGPPEPAVPAMTMSPLSPAPLTIRLPPTALNGNLSYADRPPPTPPLPLSETEADLLAAGVPPERLGLGRPPSFTGGPPPDFPGTPPPVGRPSSDVTPHMHRISDPIRPPPPALEGEEDVLPPSTPLLATPAPSGSQLTRSSSPTPSVQHADKTKAGDSSNPGRTPPADTR